jgi:hypothetical protein
VTWYQFIAPVVLVALAVRLEAKLIGPYWSWLELIPLLGVEDSATAKRRRGALLRRIALPGLATFVLGVAWPPEYNSLDALIIATSAAGLLLWPIIFTGLPRGVPGFQLALIYLAFAVAFGGAGWIGRYIAEFIRAGDGMSKFLQDNFVSLIVGGVLTAFAAGVFDRISSAASNTDADADVE